MESINKNQTKDANLNRPFTECELVIGLVGAVGTDLTDISSKLTNRLSHFGYNAIQVRVSKDVLEQSFDIPPMKAKSEFERVNHLMDIGNMARKKAGDGSITAMGAAAVINQYRPQDEDSSGHFKPRTAYIVSSLKHPDEVACLRSVYSHGFFLIGVYSDEERRRGYLVNVKRMSEKEAADLIARDMDEHLTYGQSTSETFISQISL